MINLFKKHYFITYKTGEVKGAVNTGSILVHIYIFQSPLVALDEAREWIKEKTGSVNFHFISFERIK